LPFLGEIALAQAVPPIATQLSVAWSVICLSSVTLMPFAETILMMLMMMLMMILFSCVLMLVFVAFQSRFTAARN